MADATSRVTLTFDVPFLDPSSENAAKVKALLLHAMNDMFVNNGHLMTREEYALAALLREGPYVNGENKTELEELAREAEYLAFEVFEDEHPDGSVVTYLVCDDEA